MESTLHRDLYIEPPWVEKERERVFFNQWTCVGQGDDLATAGSDETVDICGESIIPVRGADQELRAFHNVCRHRDCQLVDCTRPEQRTGRFRSTIRCPYHSWTYGLDGSLRRTPHVDVDKSRFGLHRVALASCTPGRTRAGSMRRWKT